MIIVEDYKYEWKNHFEDIRDFLLESLPVGTRIEHVGSTSVEGLAAKPIIDICIICTNDKKTSMITVLEKIGYTHRGNLGIEGREAFKPNDFIQNTLPKHHLYLGDPDAPSIRNFLLLREFLKGNKSYLEKYSILKKKNAKLYPNDIDLYIEKKSPLIAEILTKAGMDEIDVKAIYKANKSWFI